MAQWVEEDVLCFVGFHLVKIGEVLKKIWLIRKNCVQIDLYIFSKEINMSRCELSDAKNGGILELLGFFILPPHGRGIIKTTETASPARRIRRSWPWKGRERGLSMGQSVRHFLRVEKGGQK